MATEHPDNTRFFADVERWLGRPILRLQSSVYRDIDEVFEVTKYMAGLNGARCTVEMKRRPREDFQLPTDTHVFGYTAEERGRADSFERNNPALAVEWILIDEGITKTECMRQLARAGIALPAMYSLGFEHNNCLGCVKATSSDYWNRIRKLFPSVFERRARQSRLLGVRLARHRGERVFLDELPPDAHEQEEFNIDCGPACHAGSKWDA